MTRMLSRREACMVHARRRLAERGGAGWSASREQLEQAARLLKTWHRSTRPWDAVPEVVPVSAPRSDGRRQFLVQAEGARLRVVYDRKRKAVVTVLPPEGV